MENANTMAAIGALIADPTRAEMLLAMMDGRAHPATDLAAIAHVTPPTASHHLARLIEGGLVEVFQQGRHRYHRLASSQIAELLESIGSLESPRRKPKPANKLAYCRSCYDHLAGELSVTLRKRIEEQGFIVPEGDRYEITSAGTHFFADLGIRIEDIRRKRRPLAKACLDWTERLPHIGGSLGTAILSTLEEKNWVERPKGSRAVTVTTLGKESLRTIFSIEIPS